MKSTDPTTMPPATTIRVSVADWHPLTKACHCGRLPDTADGSGPAPMDPGLKKAAMADSEDVPGPHVPPTPGTGRGNMTTEAAATTKQAATTTHTTRTAVIWLTDSDRRSRTAGGTIRVRGRRPPLHSP
jgi:hypothetical protein